MIGSMIKEGIFPDLDSVAFMLPPRRHHYIPRFYLRHWADSSGQSVVYRLTGRDVSNPFRSTAENICNERDLYANRAMDVTSHDAHEAEREFSRLDSLAASAQQKLINRGQLTPTERDDWTRFLMSLFIRQPIELAGLRERALQEWRQILANAHPDLTDDLRAGIDRYQEKFQAAASVDAEDLALGTMRRVMDSERIGNVIVRMNWLVYALDETVGSFLTGDMPTLKTNGLVGDHAAIILPIAPQRLFIAAGSERAYAGMDQLPARQVRRMVNVDVVSQARQFVVATDDTQTRFIRNNR